MISYYNFDLNLEKRFYVENDFEIKKMCNNGGKMYVIGIIILGGFYAVVDMFLGL